MTNNITRGWLVLFAIIIFVGGIAVGLLSGRRNARPGGPRMSFRVAQPGGHLAYSVDPPLVIIQGVNLYGLPTHLS